MRGYAVVAHGDCISSFPSVEWEFGVLPTSCNDSRATASNGERSKSHQRKDYEHNFIDEALRRRPRNFLEVAQSVSDPSGQVPACCVVPGRRLEQQIGFAALGRAGCPGWTGHACSAAAAAWGWDALLTRSLVTRAHRVHCAVFTSLFSGFVHFYFFFNAIEQAHLSYSKIRVPAVFRFNTNCDVCRGFPAALRPPHPCASVPAVLRPLSIKRRTRRFCHFPVPFSSQNSAVKSRLRKSSAR